MSSRDNLLDDVKSCSFEANDVDNVCCTDADGAYRDRSGKGTLDFRSGKTMLCKLGRPIGFTKSHYR